MKTSLLTLVAVLSASLAQSASLSWTISNVPNQTEGYTAMLFMLEQTSSADGFVNFGKANTTVAKVTELADAGKYDDLAALAAANIDYTGAAANKPTNYNGSNFGNGDSVKAFALILDKDKKNYFLTGEKSASWTSTTGAKTLLFGSQANATYKSFGSQTIPEPATGALALAGIALLFRRRK